MENTIDRGLGKKILCLIGIVSVLLLGWLCPAVGARAQETKPLYFGTPTRSVAWFPLYVAMKRGFLQKEGINLQPVIMDSRVIVPSMASKEIPYSTGLGSTMIGASKGLPLKLVMILGGKTHLVLVTRLEIATLRELKGKTIGVTRPGSDVHRMLNLVTKSVGMDPNEVKILGVGDLTNRVNALRRKVVDGAVLSVPYDFLVEKEGFRRLAYFKDYIDVPIMGWTVHEDRIRTRPEEIKQIITGILRSVAYVKSRRQDVLPLLQEFVGLDSPDVAGKAYDAIRDMWPADGSTSEHGLRNAIAVAEIPPNVAVDQLVHWTLLREVLGTLRSNPIFR
jgi:ABC-type nitrate/sulfonate/bicarbonate transport system substrate-binding protein